MSAQPSPLTRLLVVDDSRLMLKAAQKMLGPEFDIVTAGDGDEAWKVLEGDSSIQVVFTDLNMPVADGYDLLRRIRGANDGGLQNLPVIVVTGTENDERARMQALELGATDFITKPFTSVDLLARARAHAKYQRITQQLQSQVTLDALTGLANKAGFIERLRQDIAYARRHEAELCLVRLEIDGLRECFLRLGREQAEQRVQRVASLLQARIRKEDTAGRVGLGGFALSMPGGKPDGITGVLARLQAELRVPPGDGGGVAIELKTAVFGPEASLWPSAEGALNECQEMLDADAGTPPPRVEPAPAPPVPAATAPQPVPLPVPQTAAPVAVAEAEAEAEPEPLPALDDLIEEVARGRTDRALARMPQVLQRLVPLLRLLDAGQRAQLSRFLQKLDEKA